MEVKATTKYVRISPSKARDVARLIQGKPVHEALNITEFSERKAAFHIGKTLKSAVANAQNNNELSPEELWVREAIVEEGPTMKRFQPRAQGRAFQIKKRTSHITVVVAERPATVKKG